MAISDHMTREQLLQMQASARIMQERADNVLSPWDMRAPAPVLGQDAREYRRDLAVKLKRLLPESHDLRKVQYRRLDDDVLTNFEPQLYRAVRDAAYRADTVPPGEYRRVVEIDTNGMKIVKFIGSESFVKAMTRPGRRVVSFMHKFDAGGRALR